MHGCDATMRYTMRFAMLRIAHCQAGVRDGAGRAVSAVRATRLIRRGEPCLICYLQPLELTRAARAERLLQVPRL